MEMPSGRDTGTKSQKYLNRIIQAIPILTKAKAFCGVLRPAYRKVWKISSI